MRMAVSPRGAGTGVARRGGLGGVAGRSVDPGGAPYEHDDLIPTARWRHTPEAPVDGLIGAVVAFAGDRGMDPGTLRRLEQALRQAELTDGPPPWPVAVDAATDGEWLTVIVAARGATTVMELPIAGGPPRTPPGAP